MVAVLLSYLPLLLVTLAIECAVVALVAPPTQRRPVLMVCVALNLTTHPIATALSWYRGVDVLTLELLVVAAEAIGYRLLLRCSIQTVLRYALFANFFSALAGLAIWFVRMA